MIINSRGARWVDTQAPCPVCFKPIRHGDAVATVSDEHPDDDRVEDPGFVMWGSGIVFHRACAHEVEAVVSVWGDDGPDWSRVSPGSS